jgi:mannose-6-phosphate isomerase-like protein (cupin superfamily)
MPASGDQLPDLQARRVVSGVDRNGRSTIVIDEPTKSKTATKAFVLYDIWRIDTVPPMVDAPDLLEDGDVRLDPPVNGLVVRMATIPPDSWWDPTNDYAEALSSVSDAESDPQQPVDAETDGDGEQGLHLTDTIDILTVISGELCAVLEDAEAVLKPGDTFVQRGTRHTWSNRGDCPVVAIATMVGAKR